MNFNKLIVLVVALVWAVVGHGAASAASMYFVQTDQLNTPRAITDENNVLVWKWDSDPYGAAPPNESPAGAPAFAFGLRFPGQVFDRESYLYYNYFRDYDSQTGRYIQSDPIGLEGGINTYGYVSGNPVSFTDPEGLAQTGAAAGSLIGGAIGGRLGGPAGARLGSAVGSRVGSAVQDMCSSDPKCDELNKKVQDAKDKAGKLGACRAGMTKGQLQERYRAWVDLASARAQRDETCWGGGDMGHQQAQADAWKNVGNCGNLMK